MNKQSNNIRICSQCIMDTTDPDINFNSEGVCNHCIEAKDILPRLKFTAKEEEQNLQGMKNLVSSDPNTKYDCVIGLSGGVDSSYVALIAHRLNLKALCVHFDNGWNSEIAVSNIKKIVDKCGFDLATYVIDWPEFKDLQRSFFKASVVDIEMLSDHAIMATMFKLRKQHGIKYILSGTNYATEHGMPVQWIWRKQDLVNIRDIQNKFGSKKISQFPTMNSIKYILAKKLGLGGVYLEPLNKINYSKELAMAELNKEFGWQYYGGKHFESTFTKFYQAYYLPEKFGYDKRKVHLSAQIRNGEISREKALEETKNPAYNEQELTIDKEFVLKKLGFSSKEFEEIMDNPPKAHLDYKSDEWLFNVNRLLRKLLKKK